VATLRIVIAGQNDAGPAFAGINKALDEMAGQVSKSNGLLGGLGNAIGGVTGALGKLGLAGLGVSALGDVFGGLTSGLLDGAMEAEQIAAATEAVLKSTRGAAGMSADAIADLAGELSTVTKFEDDAIQSAENLLLTFTNIGKNVFPDATETVLNMSEALGQDLKSSATQLGKALNDPVKGITALSRVGVAFTAQQKEQIEAMVKAGDVAGAQRIILKELEVEFGGAARAAGQTFAGKLAILQNQIGNVKESIGGALLPVLSGLVERATPLIVQFGEKLPAAFEWLGQTVEAVKGYLDPGNTVDLMRQWFGPDIGPRIDEVVRGVKGLLGVLADNANDSRGALYGVAGVLDTIVGELLDLGGATPFANLLTAAQALPGQIGPLIEQGRSLASAFGAELGAAWANLAPTGERLGQLLNTLSTAILSLVPSPVVDLAQGIGETVSQSNALHVGLGLLVDTINGVSGAIAAATSFIAEHKEVQAVLAGVVGSLTTAWALQQAAAAAHAVALGASTLATQGLTIAQGALNVVMSANPIVRVITLLAGLAAGVVYAYNNIEPFRNAVDSAWEAVKGFGQFLADTFMARAWEPFVAGIRTAVDLWEKLKGLVGSVQLPDLSGITQGINIPGFAEGVRNFSGGLAVVGEKGPELLNLPRGSDVIPLSPGGSDPIDYDQMGQAVARALAGMAVTVTINGQRATGVLAAARSMGVS
jgi:hypothetical protein